MGKSITSTNSFPSPHHLVESELRLRQLVCTEKISKRDSICILLFIVAKPFKIAVLWGQNQVLTLQTFQSNIHKLAMGQVTHSQLH